MQVRWGPHVAFESYLPKIYSSSFQKPITMEELVEYVEFCKENTEITQQEGHSFKPHDLCYKPFFLSLLHGKI